MIFCHRISFFHNLLVFNGILDVYGGSGTCGLIYEWTLFMGILWRGLFESLVLWTEPLREEETAPFSLDNTSLEFLLEPLGDGKVRVGCDFELLSIGFLFALIGLLIFFYTLFVDLECYSLLPPPRLDFGLLLFSVFL